MGGYNLFTRNGCNFYEILSLLQKAMRRGDENLAGFAAYEVSDRYRSALWNRIMTVASEDCWGAVSKELEALRYLDESCNDDIHLCRAVSLLCRARKSRDACYFACNFVLSPNRLNPTSVSDVDFCDASDYAYGIPDSMLTHSFLHSGEFKVSSSLKPVPEASIKKAACLSKSLVSLDIENSGHYISSMRNTDRRLLWKTLLGVSVRYGGGLLAREVIGLKLNDDRVNRSKSADRKDEIYVCKAALLVMYHLSGLFDCVDSVDSAPCDRFVDWDAFGPVVDISSCALGPEGIPEYVYDVHTSKGKRAGKTDWEMNLVEHAALRPLQPSFFDEGSWAPRYDVKHANGWCTEGEYLESLEYRKTHPDNPVKGILAAAAESRDASTQPCYDSFSKVIADSMGSWGGSQLRLI